MARTWPPSPCVEDEYVALAKEHMLDVPLQQLKSEDQPAGSRGSVDQYPIILDSHAPAQPFPSEKPTLPSKSRHPPAVNPETRFVLVPSQASESESETTRPSDMLHRSKSTAQLPELDVPRGRPHVTRIHTDVGAGLDGMRTGHRRVPSPYVHTPAGLMETLSPESRNKVDLLSPMHAQEPRRTASAHPGTRTVHRDSSDSDQKDKSSRRPERSRSRVVRQSFSHSDRSECEKIKPQKPSRRDESPDSKFTRRAHRYRSPAPPRGGFTGYTYTGQEHITPPQTPKSASDSARSSGLDQTSIHEQPHNRQAPKRLNTDSPHTSSAEESYSRRTRHEDERKPDPRARSRHRSRARGSQEDALKQSRARSQRREKSFKDEANHEHHSSDEQARGGTRTPVSTRMPLNMENYLETAFATNQSKRPREGDARSRYVSPSASPAPSPPQTPRGERSPKDYFELGSHSLKPSKQRSRPPSIDETHFRDIKTVTSSLLGVATLGASLAAKAMPALTRANTSPSLETPSSSSQSRPSSGPRSRRPSPLLEESQPVYQSLSRTNSIAVHEDGNAMRTTTYAVHEDRQVPKTAQYMPTALEPPPRANSRASSYSHSPEQPRPPAPFRAYSTAGTSNQGHQQQMHLPAHQPVLLAQRTWNLAR